MTFSALVEFGVRGWVREASREAAHEKQEIPRCSRRIQVASGTGPNSLSRPSLWKIVRIPGLGAGATQRQCAEEEFKASLGYVVSL